MRPKAPPNLLPVSANRVQLQQVLVNLILNSVDAMDAVVGRERILTIDVEGDGSVITIAVGDTGDGVKQEDLDKIFEPFYTTSRTGWVWAFLFADRSSAPTAANYGLPGETHSVRHSI